MKQRRITYGVHGMMEYQAVIKIGRGIKRITFSDGSASSFGESPAIYTTENLMIQEAIENSAEYKRGLIKRVRAIELEKDVEILRNPHEGPEVGSENKGETAEAGVDAAPTEADAPSTKDEDVLTEKMNVTVQVSGNEEAREYLEKEFGVQKGKLRTRTDILSVGLQYGVEFEFTK